MIFSRESVYGIIRVCLPVIAGSRAEAVMERNYLCHVGIVSCMEPVGRAFSSSQHHALETIDLHALWRHLSAVTLQGDVSYCTATYCMHACTANLLYACMY